MDKDCEAVLRRLAAEIRQSLGNGATVSTRRRWAIELEQIAALTREAAPPVLDAVAWLRNNYDAYPNIASLCDAMLAASPAAPAQQAVTDDMVRRALDGTLPNGHRVWAYVACADPDPSVTGREVMRAALEAIAGEQS